MDSRIYLYIIFVFFCYFHLVIYYYYYHYYYSDILVVASHAKLPDRQTVCTDAVGSYALLSCENQLCTPYLTCIRFADRKARRLDLL